MAVGGLFDLDDMLSSNNTGPSGLGGIDLGGALNQGQPQPVSNDMGFGFGNDADQEPAEEQSDWANAFGGESGNSSSQLPLDFAKP